MMKRSSTPLIVVPVMALLLLMLTMDTCRTVMLGSRSLHSLQREGFDSACVKAALALCRPCESCPIPAGAGSGHDNSTTPSALPDAEVKTYTAAAFRLKGRRGRHCQDLKDAGDEGRGVREVFPYRCCPDWGVLVYCDHDTDGGGWTVFQRRADIVPRLDFYRTWVEYEQGFGHLEAEFWLGLEPLHVLSNLGLHELRVDLGDCEGNTRYASYGFFHLAGAETGYTMHCGRYSGDAGDSLSKHSASRFFTYDQDTSSKCVQLYLGAWWHEVCHYSNLNGKFYGGRNAETDKGVLWDAWLGRSYSLCNTELKIRPARFSFTP